MAKLLIRHTLVGSCACLILLAHLGPFSATAQTETAATADGGAAPAGTCPLTSEDFAQTDYASVRTACGECYAEVTAAVVASSVTWEKPVLQSQYLQLQQWPCQLLSQCWQHCRLKCGASVCTTTEPCYAHHLQHPSLDTIHASNW